ncbi:hypothetical protein [Promicromonospora sukumoe]|uniref:hypothetical protein n=1 Tax=Promicromonospora sukumoe TaxID=88382 RepID=UPI00037FEF2F|nr:hypothetical protein [Promicromonospora sukumoe]
MTPGANNGDYSTVDTPVWLKSLASSFDRRYGATSVLPLTVVVDEIATWVDLASGVDAWKPAPNRNSFRLDLDQSTNALGSSVRAAVAVPLARFDAAFTRLTTGPKSVLAQPPGTRTDAAWADIAEAASELLTVLDSEEATVASWDDLVAVAHNRTLAGGQHRPVADLLFDQLQRRGQDADGLFSTLASLIALGSVSEDDPLTHVELPAEDRLAQARAMVCAPVPVEPVVVWLGYRGGRPAPRLDAGRVTFMDAHWTVPNAGPAGQDFEHKAELWQLVQHGFAFQVREENGKRWDVDLLVRVDLGQTTTLDAAVKAANIVDTILSVAIHNHGGIRPRLTQHAVLRSGRRVSSSFTVNPDATGFTDDTYGASIMFEAVHHHGPRIADALSREALPRFLAAAIEVQAAADHPFSRDMAMHTPSDADIRSVVPLADRVVQHVAAHAGIGPDEAFELLGQLWPHARWLSDLELAVHLCTFGGDDRQGSLLGAWYSVGLSKPRPLFIADHAEDLLSVCQIESERPWIARMLRSVSDAAIYGELIKQYSADGAVLEARRRRVRNGLVHGNPTSFEIVKSVREYATFLSSGALRLGIEAYVQQAEARDFLAWRSPDVIAMQSGQDAAAYWRQWLATQPSS